MVSVLSDQRTARDDERLATHALQRTAHTTEQPPVLFFLDIVRKHYAREQAESVHPATRHGACDVSTSRHQLCREWDRQQRYDVAQKQVLYVVRIERQLRWHTVHHAVRIRKAAPPGSRCGQGRA